jgi:hypothetical protein
LAHHGPSRLGQHSRRSRGADRALHPSARRALRRTSWSRPRSGSCWC